MSLSRELMVSFVFARVSVSRAVKPLVEDARPPDYFSQKASWTHVFHRMFSVPPSPA